jgi:hypothetical protein
MATQKILVPYNFTSHEEKALDFVVGTFANREDIQLTLFNAYTPLPTIDMDASPELSKMRPGLAALSGELREKEAGLKSAKEYLVQNGFSEEQIDYVFKERSKSVSDEIIEAVTKGHYRVLVLSRQPKVRRLFGRGTHTKVLASLKDITICIAS